MHAFLKRVEGWMSRVFLAVRTVQFLRKVSRCITSPNSYDITDPVERRFAALYVAIIDHGILRSFWTNHAQVADGVWRSNHPTNKRLRHLARSGFKSIINLRGNHKMAHHKFEVEICADLGMDLWDVPMSARTAPDVKNLVKLISALGEVKKPGLLHCKSGADRTGLASAIYLLVYRNATPREAKKHLSLRFLHVRNSHAGILDYLLDTYEERLTSGPISFLSWVTNEYDPIKITAGFASLKKNGKL